MKRKAFLSSLVLASILPFCSFMAPDNGDTTPKEEQTIVLTNKTSTQDSETLQVPVTATVNNQVLNVRFTGTVPHATVKVNNALTGGTVSQQSMTAVSGTICTVPVSGLTMGTYTVSVTNNLNGQSVSGEFDVE